MKKKRKILGIAGGLLFMAFVAVNLTVSQSYQGNESVAQLTLVELAAKAQSGDEHGCQSDQFPPVYVGCGGQWGCCHECEPNPYLVEQCNWTGYTKDFCPWECGM
ncbi:hypothetical protein [Membranihabitans maritimus]|uniref:hypothetical protein n=1 Tax=Membranihabitans maritimus TaxID=2904244 RepID=UPI001F20847A|nr:hypothetical protein [Membranihabitans maritimus]